MLHTARKVQLRGRRCDAIVPVLKDFMVVAAWSSLVAKEVDLLVLLLLDKFEAIRLVPSVIGGRGFRV